MAGQVVEPRRCKLLCACGRRLDEWTLPLGADRPQLVRSKAERRAEKAATGQDAMIYFDRIEHVGHAARRTAHVPGGQPSRLDRMRMGRRCGKCGADWQWREARLMAALTRAMNRGEKTLDARLV